MGIVQKQRKTWTNLTDQRAAALDMANWIWSFRLTKFQTYRVYFNDLHAPSVDHIAAELRRWLPLWKRPSMTLRLIRSDLENRKLSIHEIRVKVLSRKKKKKDRHSVKPTLPAFTVDQLHKMTDAEFYSAVPPKTKYRIINPDLH